jgi:hypothetical protein
MGKQYLHPTGFLRLTSTNTSKIDLKMHPMSFKYNKTVFMKLFFSPERRQKQTQYYHNFQAAQYHKERKENLSGS